MTPHKTEPQWLTQADYARLKGVTRAAVLKMIKTGRVETNGKEGRECRVRDKVIPATLESAKLAKLQVDVELQKQKIMTNIEASRRVWVEMILEELIRAYTPVKIRLTELRLTPEQTESLRLLLESCEASFLAGVRGRMSE